MDCDSSKNPSRLRASKTETKSCDGFALASITLYILFIYFYFKSFLKSNKSVTKYPKALWL